MSVWYMLILSFIFFPQACQVVWLLVPYGMSGYLIQCYIKQVHSFYHIYHQKAPSAVLSVCNDALNLGKKRLALSRDIGVKQCKHVQLAEQKSMCQCLMVLCILLNFVTFPSVPRYNNVYIVFKEDSYSVKRGMNSNPNPRSPNYKT